MPKWIYRFYSGWIYVKGYQICSDPGNDSMTETNTVQNVFQIKIDQFEGPLDLLWGLIQKSKLDITSISISRITGDFIAYIALMKILDVDVSADFTYMASNLLYYKSKALLPIDPGLDEEYEPPLPPELVQQLLEYKKYQKAARNLENIEERSNDFYLKKNDQIMLEFPGDENWNDVNILDLIEAFTRITAKIGEKKSDLHKIEMREYSLDDSIAKIRNKIFSEKNFLFNDLFTGQTDALEIVTTFLAILEMVRMKEIVVRQHRLFGDIRVFQSEQAPVHVDQYAGENADEQR